MSIVAFLSRCKWFSALFVFSLVGISLLVSGCAANNCLSNCPQTTSLGSNSSTDTGNSPVVIITSAPSSHTIWLSKAVTSGDVITGPAVISGDFDINNTSVKDGQADIGTVIVLLDSSQYTLSGPNSGTIYYVSRGQPTEKELTDKARQVISDQKLSGCSGGCRQSKIVYFRSGQQEGSPQYV